MTQARQNLTIRDARSGRAIAEARADQYQKVEGNWYIDPAAVERRFTANAKTGEPSWARRS